MNRKHVSPAYATAGMRWDELLVLLEKAPDFAARVLRYPCASGRIDLGTFLKLDRAASASGLETLFRRHLISGLAQGLTPRDFDHDVLARCASSCRPVHEAVIANNWPHDCSWICFPVITCRGMVCSETWILAGTTYSAHKKGQWLAVPNGSFSPESLAAVKSALSAASSLAGTEKTRHAIPVLIPLAGAGPNNAREAISGRSLGLPVALAMLLMRQGKSWPPHLFATGNLDENGRVNAVALVSLKQEYAVEHDAFLIYPESPWQIGSSRRLSHNGAPDFLLPCGTLSQAAEYIDCLMMNKPDEDEVHSRHILLYSACNTDPSLFLRNFRELPIHFIKGRNFRALIDAIARQPAKYLGEYAACLSSVSDDMKRGQIIADIYTPDQLVELAEDEPAHAVAAFRVAAARIAMFGHDGNTRDLKPWCHAAEKLKGMAGSQSLAAYFNQRVTSILHNRFEFRPRLPDEFMNALELEEKVMRLRGDENWLLGAMHGTAAQNYGFCGAQWLANTEYHVKKGQAAFGKRWPQDNERLLNYLTYALLDAGMMNRAARKLLAYLAPENRGNQAELQGHALLRIILHAAQRMLDKPDASTPFKLALAMRFAADAGEHADTRHSKPVMTTEQARRILFAACQNTGHPWQLVTLNAGRIMIMLGHQEIAASFFYRALEICMKGSITMNVMGLLPLAYMHTNGLYNAYKLSQYIGKPYSSARLAEQIVEIISDDRLVSTFHFRKLLCAKSHEQLLEMVATEPGNWFPFSYR